MSIVIRCTSEDKIYCPICCSKNIVSRNTEHSHCGNCGSSVLIEYVEHIKIEESKEKDDFVQLSLFEEI